MLILNVELQPAQDLRDSALPDMLALANQTQCQIVTKAGDITFWVFPGDEIEQLQTAFDHFYPALKLLYAGMKPGAPEEPLTT